MISADKPNSKVTTGEKNNPHAFLWLSPQGLFLWVCQALTGCYASKGSWCSAAELPKWTQKGIVPAYMVSTFLDS